MNSVMRKYRKETREMLRDDHASRKPGFRFYWAYGSNLCKDNMRERCPLARPYAPLIVDDGLLVFRGVADVVHSPGNKVAGALWKITPSCERALDRYEGVASGLYVKKYMTIRTQGETHPVLYYKMRSGGVMPGNEHYLRTIFNGYQDWDLDIDLLDWSHKDAYASKEVTEFLASRRKRRGGRIAAPDFIERLAGQRLNRVKELVTMPEDAGSDRVLN